VSNKKSLLLLGSTGFLGSTVLKKLNSAQMPDWEIILSQSSTPDNTLSFTIQDFGSLTSRQIEVSKLADFLGKDLVVMNCASSRNSGNNESSKQGNFEFPKRVLQALLEIEGLSTRWIQIETFWQYSKDAIPDPNYVFWKNQFKEFLNKVSDNNKLTIDNLTLSHLVGPFDNPNRFLPKVFAKMLRNEEVLVNSPDEDFSMTDVRDVAEYLISTLNKKRLEQDSQSLLFPFNEESLREIVTQFIKISGSQSQVQFKESIKISNPRLVLSEQPALLHASLTNLRSLESTFYDMSQWLAELHEIDNIQL